MTTYRATFTFESDPEFARALWKQLSDPLVRDVPGSSGLLEIVPNQPALTLVAAFNNPKEDD